MLDVLVSIYSRPEVKALVVAIVANLILGVVASIRLGDFRLHRLADWLTSRVIPLLAGYGVAAFLAYSSPDFVPIRDLALVTLMAALLGYVKQNIQDIIAGKPPTLPEATAPATPPSA